MVTQEQLLALKRPGIDNDPDAEPWDGGWNAAIDEVVKLLEPPAHDPKCKPDYPYYLCPVCYPGL